MKKSLLLFLMSLYSPLVMFAEVGDTFTAKTAEGYDMIFTILDESDKTCQVGYLDGDVDKTALDGESVEGSLTIPETVNGYTVVKIGKYAFAVFYKMTSVTIPNTVTAIDDCAFQQCIGLTSFELPASVTNIGNSALYALGSAISIKVAKDNQNYDSRDNCNAIIETATNKLLFGCKTTTIPSSVTGICSYAFAWLPELNLFIPSSVTQIETSAFWGTNYVIQVEYTTPPAIDGSEFRVDNSSLIVPLGCKEAYSKAWGWKRFSNIFEGNECSSFTAKTTEDWDMVFTILDESAKTCQIGYIDGDWDKLAIDKNIVNGSVTIPETANGYTVVKIGKYAFGNIKGMTSINIPETVTSIDEYALYGCEGLSSLEISENVNIIGWNALSGLSGVTSIKVAEGNTIYDSRDNCNAIIETATNYLLYGCKTTTIPRSVTAIRSYAFYYFSGCSFLIPSSITKIDDFAFNGTDFHIKVENATPLEIEGAFVNLSNSVLEVPIGSKAAYTAATGWKDFKEIIETAPEPQGATFDEDVEESASKEVQVTFVVMGNDETGTPTVAVSDDKDASGSVSIPEAVTHNGVEYKVTEIGEGAFQNNTGLTEVKIHASITSIGAKAFAGCKNLQAITINIIVPINIAVISARGFTRTNDGDVFEGVDKETCILYVPEGSVDAYKAAAGWKEFKNILAIGTTGIHGVVVSHGESFDVFTLSGLKVKSKVTSLDGLPNGIYIVNGKKVMKK